MHRDVDPYDVAALRNNVNSLRLYDSEAEAATRAEFLYKLRCAQIRHVREYYRRNNEENDTAEGMSMYMEGGLPEQQQETNVQPTPHWFSRADDNGIQPVQHAMNSNGMDMNMSANINTDMSSQPSSANDMQLDMYSYNTVNDFLKFVHIQSMTRKKSVQK